MPWNFAFYASHLLLLPGAFSSFKLKVNLIHVVLRWLSFFLASPPLLFPPFMYDSGHILLFFFLSYDIFWFCLTETRFPHDQVHLTFVTTTNAVKIHNFSIKPQDGTGPELPTLPSSTTNPDLDLHSGPRALILLGFCRHCLLLGFCRHCILSGFLNGMPWWE